MTIYILQPNRGGGVDYPTGSVSEIHTIPDETSIKIFWSDPLDRYWGGTKLVRKEGSSPIDENDGVLLTDSRVRNQYKYSNDEGPCYVDEGLTTDKTYYYGLFPHSRRGIVTNNEAGKFSATPVKPFTVTWKNWDGSILKTEQVKQSAIPSYDGEDPTYENSKLYPATFSFTGWTPAPAAVNSDVIYTAKYDISGLPTGMSETITKSWDEIIADAEAGNNSGYNLLDTKIMICTDGQPLCYELAAKDLDTLVDGGTASMTWISRTMDGTCKWNTSDDDIGGYPESNYKKYLETTCLSHFPDNIKAAMKMVTKTYRMSKNESGVTNTVNLKIWAPSAREIGHVTCPEYRQETSGVKYDIYTSQDQCKRYRGSSSDDAWLRTATADYIRQAMQIRYTGECDRTFWDDFGVGALPCFCLGKTK